MQKPKSSKSYLQSLRCPACNSPLNHSNDGLTCKGEECRKIFPVKDDIPILINETRSVFAIDDFMSKRNTTFSLKKNKIKDFILRLIPDVSENINAKRNYKKLTNLLLKQNSSPRVLIIGGSIMGKGMEVFMLNPAIDFVESDVSFGERTMLICDAHDLPFADQCFDGVIAQAVLEHVTDPYRCVDEIYRVLKTKGLVYAETPFLQQVHMGPYDFTRFTHLGHRRLFRKFDEIESGATCGPGMALAWAYQGFLQSFAKSNALKKLIFIFASFTSFYLKYFDYYLIDKPGALDSASGIYFMGSKGDNLLSDQELIKLYKGAMQI
jgi:SAM-dependent methyltransferase